jgi:hypothetical protein
MLRRHFFRGAQSKYLQAARRTHCWGFYLRRASINTGGVKKRERDACTGKNTAKMMHIRQREKKSWAPAMLAAAR